MPGFDIPNYKKIRKELSGLGESATDEDVNQVFINFISEAHKRNINVIFDIALNHTSEEHKWFINSKKQITGNKHTDLNNEFYIWQKDDKKYKDARLLFKGMCPSNWEKFEDMYFFHRFFEFQPDLNYRNPVVLIEMCRNLLYWASYGVDGFRADAIPYLWKEENTNCENLPQTHTIVKFFRAILDFVKPGFFLLAEACQLPNEVVKYFGDEDECHAGYHFPLMPQMFISFATQNCQPIKEVLDKKRNSHLQFLIIASGFYFYDYTMSLHWKW